MSSGRAFGLLLHDFGDPPELVLRRRCPTWWAAAACCSSPAAGRRRSSRATRPSRSTIGGVCTHLGDTPCGRNVEDIQTRSSAGIASPAPNRRASSHVPHVPERQILTLACQFRLTTLDNSCAHGVFRCGHSRVASTALQSRRPHQPRHCRPHTNPDDRHDNLPLIQLFDVISDLRCRMVISGSQFSRPFSRPFRRIFSRPFRRIFRRPLNCRREGRWPFRSPPAPLPVRGRRGGSTGPPAR